MFGNNVSCPKARFLEAGGAAEWIVRYIDTELAFRLGSHGARFVYLDRALAWEDDRETLWQALDDAALRGSTSLVLHRGHPALLPYLPIGGRSELGWKRRTMRRALLAARVPIRVAACLACLVPGEERSAEADRLLFSYAYWRGVQQAADRDTWHRLARGTTILTYHAIGRPGERGSKFVVPRCRFARQISWLSRRYTVIPLDDLAACFREHRLPPAKSVVITFEDGYEDSLSIALPILERSKLPWTLFVPSAAGSRNTWDDATELAGRGLINPGQLKNLSPTLTVGGTRGHTST